MFSSNPIPLSRFMNRHTGGRIDYNDEATLRALVPSVFETALSEKVSEKYQRIPTIRVLEALKEAGWMITRAQQSKSQHAYGLQGISGEVGEKLVFGLQLPLGSVSSAINL